MKKVILLVLMFFSISAIASVANEDFFLSYNQYMAANCYLT